MQVNSRKFLALLKTVEPGISAAGPFDQSMCFIFLDGRVWTFNDSVCYSTAAPSSWKMPDGALKSKSILSLLGSLSSQDLEIAVEGKVFSMKGESCRLRQPWDTSIRMPLSDIPVPKKWVNLPKDFFKNVCIAAESSATRVTDNQRLTCIHLTSKYVEASDNFEITRAEWKSPLGDADLLMKASPLQELSRYGMSKASVGKEWIHFTDADEKVRVSVRLLSVDYPDWSPFLKKAEGGDRLTFVGDVDEALGRLASVSPAEGVLYLSVQKNRVRLSVQADVSYREVVESKFDGRDGASRHVRLSALSNLLRVSRTVRLHDNSLFAINEGVTRVVCTIAPPQKEGKDE